MSETLFRKEALAKASSPDQLDQTIQVAGPLYWATLAAVLLGLASAGVWSLTGTISTKALGEGTVIRPGGVFSISAAGGGYVTALRVKVGDRVRAGDVIAEVDQPAADDDVRALQDHLAELRGQAHESVSLREDTAALQVKSLQVQRQNAQSDMEDQRKLEKISAEELQTDQQLFAKGLITRQPVIDAQQRLLAIRSGISRDEAEITRIDSQAFESKWQPTEMRKQRELEIHDLEGRLNGLRNRARLTSSVVAPLSGEVVEEKIYPGALIAPGAPVISIQPDNDELVAAIYVPSTRAKEITAGMDAEISPSTAKREEYGFIRGKVTRVGHFPATTSAMMTLFENDSLVGALQAKGMVTEVDVVMERATDTPSGFRWSSSRGPEAGIVPGTLCTAQIVTRAQKPIELVFPFLRKITGLH